MPDTPSSPGPGVDAAGRPVIDPTANVLLLVAAAMKRQDDLREAADMHVREMADLRAHYDGLLRQAETDRIDAIRAVDVGAVQRAAEVALTQASTLAAQVATSAETLRTQVAAAATASQVSLAAALVPIQEAIADLRRAQYEAQGVKSNVGDARQNIGAWVAVAVLVVLVLGLILTQISRS
jgi:hypothetical protein